MVNRIGHYELTADLGSGAMGKVYLARDTRLDREVALKVLWPQLAEQPAAVARFEREARAVARLKHANVVAVHDIGAADGYHYLAMEYVAGCSLRELLKQPLPVEKTLHYFKQILAGLGVAHEQGVIHRDLKPGNILIETATDTVKLADFGLARIMEEEISITQSGEMLGTLEYMAPELSRGESAGCKSDLYAAGVVLYRLLTGRFPFQGATPSAILKAHECGTYPPASKIMAGLPQQADGILARLLACEPANRYADCQAVFADLQRWEKGEEIPLEFAVTYEPIDHEIDRYRVPGWKRMWTRVTSWYRYQWLEAFNRTELTVVRVQDEVRATEAELGKARRRMEEATLLRNRVRARSDEARALMQKCEQAAEQAHAAGDETRTRQHLAAKLEAQERAEDLDKEAAESEQVLVLAQQEYESRSATIAELRHNADLLLARRRRAKMEMSVLGALPAGERRLGERLLAATKLFGPLLAIGGCLYYLFRMPLPPVPPGGERQPAAQSQPAVTSAPGPPVAASPVVAAGTSRELSPLMVARQNAGVVECNGRLYVIGGLRYNPTAFLTSVESYDPVTDVWRAEPAMPTPRAAMAVVEYNGEIYAIGGGNQECGPDKLGVMEIYNPVTRSWRRGPPLPQSRAAASGVALDGKIYVIGGQTYGARFQRVDVYDVASGTWSRGPDLSEARYYAAAAALNGRIIVMGGASVTPEQFSRGDGGHDASIVEILDPAEGRWRLGAPLPVACLGMTAAVRDGRIHVFGGAGDGGYTYHNSVFAGDGESWQAMPPLLRVRAYAGAATVRGRTFIAGGVAGPQPGQIDSLEEYLAD